MKFPYPLLITYFQDKLLIFKKNIIFIAFAYHIKLWLLENVSLLQNSQFPLSGTTIQTNSLIMLAHCGTNSARAKKDAQFVTFPVASVPLKMLYVNL